MNLSWRAVFGGVIAIAAVLPAPASAGTYDVWSCRGPDGAALSAGAWQAAAIVDGARVDDTCAAGGSLRLSLTVEHDPTAAGTLRLTPPAGTRIAGYELYRATDDGPIP